MAASAAGSWFSRFAGSILYSLALSILRLNYLAGRSSSGGGLQCRPARRDWCDSSTGFQSPSIAVEKYTFLAARKELPNRNTERANLMLVHYSHRERRCQPGLHRSVREGSRPPSYRALCRRPSGLQTLTVKSRLLTGENSVRSRGNPPFPHPW
jgi:hypothetical protein